MKLQLFDDVDSIAQAAASTMAADARAAMAARGRFALAVSGRHTPWIMLRALVAPDGHPDRNLIHLRESLLQRAPLRPEQFHAMNAESPHPEAAAALYARARCGPSSWVCGSWRLYARQPAASRAGVENRSNEI
jgi:6-phosphogluconolactonase